MSNIHSFSLEKSSAVFLIISALLSGCGGGDTKIVERDPIPIEDDHNHEPAASSGRLLISDMSLAQVKTIDITKKAVLGQFAVSAIPSAIYASPNNRYAYIIQRTSDRVDVIDGGLWQEDHGDHKHDYDKTPAFVNFNTNFARPTHFTETETQSVIFFDGNADTGTAASVGVYNESDLEKNTLGNRLEFTTHMHGAAQARGNYLLATLRDPATTNTLPTQVGLYQAYKGFYEQEQVFSESCPGLHGSAQNKNAVVFGCTDGVLVIDENNKTFSAKKIVNPASFAVNQRIGTALGHENVTEFVGIAGSQFLAINTSTDNIKPISWVATGATPVPTALAYGFADEGEFFVILDSQGWLNVLDSSTWAVKNRVQVITSNLAELASGTRFELALTPNHFAYVTDPISKQVKKINLDKATVEDTIPLNFTPGKVAWLGIASPSTDHHNH